MKKWNEWDGESIPNNLGFEGIPEALDAGHRRDDKIYELKMKIQSDIEALGLDADLYLLFEHDTDFISIAGLGVSKGISYFAAEAVFYEQRALARDKEAKARIDRLSNRINEMMRSR